MRDSRPLAGQKLFLWRCDTFAHRLPKVSVPLRGKSCFGKSDQTAPPLSQRSRQLASSIARGREKVKEPGRILYDLYKPESQNLSANRCGPPCPPPPKAPAAGRFAPGNASKGTPAGCGKAARPREVMHRQHRRRPQAGTTSRICLIYFNRRKNSGYISIGRQAPQNRKPSGRRRLTAQVKIEKNE